jgi:hypothetical protein
MGVAPKKKNCEGFPMFFTLKILKEPFWATWCSGGVVISIVIVFIVVVIVVADLVSKEGRTMQKANKLVMVSKRLTGRKKRRATVRSLTCSSIRSFVRLSSWSKEDDNGEAKK